MEVKCSTVSSWLKELSSSSKEALSGTSSEDILKKGGHGPMNLYGKIFITRK